MSEQLSRCTACIGRYVMNTSVKGVVKFNYTDFISRVDQIDGFE